MAQVLERELSARSACFAEANHRAHALGEPFNALLAEFVEAAERQRGGP